LTAAAGRVKGDAGWGPGGILQLADDLPVPQLPRADGWMRLRPELAGICGSDLGLAHAKLSFVLSAIYQSQRLIPGHEIVAVVEACGPGVTGFGEGDRVVVDPVISCVHKGFDPVCRTCALGYPQACERFDQPGVVACTSPAIGFSETVGGGWGEVFVAHQSQCYAIGSVPSRRAVLAEPMSIGLHAALRWQRQGDRAVVIGPGTIGLGVVAALRMIHPDLDIAVVSPGAFGNAKALEAGATRVLPAGAAAVETLATADGGRVLRPRMTTVPVLEQGVDVVLDCVGSPDTTDLAMHLLRPRGTMVLVGAAGKQTADWSLVWHRELTVAGTVNSGPEPALGGRRTMAQVAEWLADPAYRIDGLVTHTFDLDRWTEGLRIASAGPAEQAVKVTLRPNAQISLVETPVMARSR
jgi:threonine dehydrogenase-like Zn-dependent dehydrogenase